MAPDGTNRLHYPGVHKRALWMDTCMQVTELSDNGVTVLTVEGRLDAIAAPEAERAFLAAANSPGRWAVLDLSGVEYISSGGLRAAFLLLRTLEKGGGALAVCGLSPFVAEVFETTRLSERFRVHATRGEALAAMHVSRASSQDPAPSGA